MKKLYFLCLTLLPFLLFSQKETNEWTVVATYEIPGKAGGITFDGEFLYSGLYSSPGDDNRIFKIDPTDGSYELLCYAPIEDALGLSFDGTYFWSTDRQGSYDPALAVQFDEDGNFISDFELPATYFSGIEYMEDGTFWATCYYDPDGTAFHLDDQGNVLDQFITPNNQPWAICKMDENLWIADYDADMLYLVDVTGQVIESHESIGIKPTGVVFDGTYLWYVTGPAQSNSTLYKVDLGGSGNPILDIQPQNINLEDHLVGSSSSFDLEFSNSGGSNGVFTMENLSGSGLSLLNLNDIPETLEVEAGASETITINVEYLNPGIFDLVLLFSTNDAVNDEFEIHIFGEITNDGPVLETNVSTLYFNNVRKFANTRRFIQFINSGDENLEITEINFTNNTFYLDDGTNLPMQISSLDTLSIGVWFYPLSMGDFDSEMNISSNDPDSPTNINLMADAIETDNSMGQLLWSYQITDGYDQSPKAMLGIGDISGDDVGDVIVCAENNKVMCFNGNSSGTADLLWSTEIYSGNVYQQNGIDYLDDVNDDGYEDFIIGTSGGDRSVNCISAKTGAIIWKFQTNEVGDGGWVYQVYGQKDFNGDGINDALAAAGDDSNDTGPKCVFLIDGSTGEKIWRAPLYGPAFSVIAVEDFTGDGNFDVIAGASNESESQGKVVGINGSNGQVVWNFETSGTSVWALAPLGDLNGDEIADVMAGDFSGYYYFLDATNGNELENGGIGNHLILRFLELDDINEDGYPDILIASSSINTYLIDGYSSDAIWSTTLDDKSWNLAVANDLTMDGFNEVMAGSLFSNNYSYFLDGVNGEELSKKTANAAIDALCSIDDICRDYTMEMVVGDRNGLLNCYSGGLDGTVIIPENENTNKLIGMLISPNPTTDHMYVQTHWPQDEIIDLEIIEASSGKTWSIGQTFIKNTDSQIDIPIPGELRSQLSSGLFFLKMRGAHEEKTAKFIYLKK